MKSTTTLKRNIISLLFVCTTFLVTSSAYISWYYKVAMLFSPDETDFIAQTAAYFIHAIGILLFSLIYKKKPEILLDHFVFPGIMISWLILSYLSMIVTDIRVMLALTVVSNLVLGFVFAFYLILFAKTVPSSNSGTVFGLAIAVASIGAYVISLPMGGKFLNNPKVWIFYMLLTVISIILEYILIQNSPSPDIESSQNETVPSKTPSLMPNHGKTIRYILICGLTVLFVHILQNMGFYYPSADITQSGISLEFSRAFYSIGLITAGIIFDKSRNTGYMVSCTTLAFPFISLLLLDNLTGSLVVWILAHIMLGFFAVCRILLFTDYAQKKGLLYLAGFGYLFGRLGEGIGVFLGIVLSQHRTVHIIATTLIFAIAVITTFILFGMNYSGKPEVSAESATDPYVSFSLKYELSARETQIMKLLLEGASNKEIAAGLYISENTVKFHVKNIYKKTGSANRKDLSRIFYS